MLLLSFWILAVCFAVSNAYNSGFGQHYPGLFYPQPAEQPEYNGYDYPQPQVDFELPTYGQERSEYGFPQNFQPQSYLDQSRGLDYYPNAIDQQQGHHQNHGQHSGGHQHNFEYFPNGFPHHFGEQHHFTNYHRDPPVVEIFEEQQPTVYHQEAATPIVESSNDQSRNKTHGLHLARGGYGPNARIHHHSAEPFISHPFTRNVRGLQSATGDYSPNAINGVDRK